MTWTKSTRSTTICPKPQNNEGMLSSRLSSAIGTNAFKEI